MTRQKEQEGLEIPDPVLPVFYKLGPENIFAWLYAGTFMGISLEEEESLFLHQIRPHTQGMLDIETLNKTLTIGYKHPNHKTLKRLHTPYVTDFIVASALCGSDLDIEQDLNLLQQTQHILSDPDPQTAFETTFEGQSLDDIINLLPVFDHRSPDFIHLFFGNGLSYAFYPPRITQLKNENEREAICNGFRYNFKNSTPYHGNNL